MRKLLFFLALLPAFAFGQTVKTTATFDHVRARVSLRIGSGASVAATGIANVMPGTPGTQLITAAGVYNWFTGTITFAGDVAGPYNNLQIGTATVGANELASTTVTAGTYGSGTAVPVVTVDADGRVTGVTTAAVSGGGSGVAVPANRIPFGDVPGTGITNDTTLGFNPTTDKLRVSSPSNKGYTEIGKGIEVQPDSLLTQQTLLKILGGKTSPYTYAPFGLGVEYGLQSPNIYPYKDYVWTFGPNALGNSGVSFEPTKPMASINWETSWVSGGQPVFEWHEHFKEPDSNAVRLKSYTIQYKNALFPSAISDINLYQKADGFGIASPDGVGKGYFSIARSRSTGIVQTRMRTTKDIELAISDGGSSDIALTYYLRGIAASGLTQQLTLANFGTISLGGPTITNINGRITVPGDFSAGVSTTGLLFESATLGQAAIYPNSTSLTRNNTNYLFTTNSTGTDIVYNGASGANLQWRVGGVANSGFSLSSAGNIGINTANAPVKLYINSTDAVRIPAGTTLQEPAGEVGMLRYDFNLGKYRAFLSGTFVNILTASDADSYWKMGGNTVVAGTQFLGSTNSVSLRLRTNNVERMRIDSVGKIQFGPSAFGLVFDPGIALGQAAIYPTGVTPGGSNWLFTTNNTGSDVLLNSATKIEFRNAAGVASGLTVRDSKVGIHTNTPDDSAVLDIVSTTQGMLPPRMTTTQRNAISSPATALTLFCTDATATDGSTGVMQTWNGATWKNNW